MKVLLFSWEYPPHMVGGLGQHVYDISRYLVQLDVEVHIITPRVTCCPDYEKTRNVNIHRVGDPIDEASIDDFKSWTFNFNSEAIREAVRLNSVVGGFSLVHAHDWIVAYAGRAVAKIFEIPLVTTIHATEHGRNLGLHNRVQMEINEIEKNLALEANHIICCSQYMHHEICSLFDIHPDAVTIIPNGVEPEQFLPLPAEPSIEIDPEEKVVFSLGRLVPEKGLWHLMTCFPLVLESIPEARLYIGGRGPQKHLLEQTACQLGIEDRVVFTGFIRDKERNYIYNRASVAVFPSLYEPFGIVALEAMATQTPVIVSNVGGLAEIVQNNVTGLKVPCGTEVELAQAIISILGDKDLAGQLVQNAAQLVESVYNWKVIAQSTIDVYEKVLARTKQKKEVV